MAVARPRSWQRRRGRAGWLLVAALAFGAPLAVGGAESNVVDFGPIPTMTELPEGPAPFEYVEVGAKIPNYVPSETWGTQGAPLARMQQALSAEESLRRMVTPEGFRVELFAAEPDIGKPLAMTWDERGRLWLAESVDYPNDLRPLGRGRDRIRICEDADGDGRAEQFTVFAEGLSIPTSLALARGGVIVHNGTETLFLRDVDGDDRADERRVLLASWLMGDTHGGPSNMQYGLDNWIWGMQGYNKSTIRIGDKATAFAQGFHRFRPDGSAIEFIRSTNNNTWGLGVSEEGIVFGSTANGNPSDYMPIPNRYYERVRGWTPSLTLEGIAQSNRIQPITDKVRQVDHHGGHTAAVGHALYTARAYPREYWNRTAFVCEPTGHLVGTFVLAADGAGFQSASPFNLLASDDEWTAPTMAEVGPDGCVWVIDWYNYIVQHNPTPAGFETGRGSAYESGLRDKTHGRIYRIVHDSAAPAKRLDLSKASADELVDALGNDNLFWRRHAQRLLVERGERDVVPRLLALVADQSVDTIGLNAAAIHALWTLDGLGAIDKSRPAVLAAVAGALRHPSAGVRRNAVQVLPRDEASTELILRAGLLEDPSDQVCLMALLALADQPLSAEAGRAAARFLADAGNGDDRWLVDAATSAASAHTAEFLTALAGAPSPTAAQRSVAAIVANHLARTAPGAVNGLVAALGEADPALAGAVIAGLAAGWPEGARLTFDEAARTAFDRLRTRMSLDDQVHLARLAVRSGSADTQPLIAGLTDALFQRVENVELDVRSRGEAAALVVAVHPESAAVAERLLALVTPQAAPELSKLVLRSLEDCRAPRLGEALLEQAEALAPATRAEAFDVLLGRPALTAALVDALERGIVDASELSLLHKERLDDNPNLELRARGRAALARGRENISEDRRQVLADHAEVARAAGDAANGKQVFTKNCATCHRLRGEGVAIGPDLSGMAVHGKEQLLVHILDPNRDVEGNFVSYSALLVDGLVVSGMLVGESATTIELVDAQAKRHALLREDVESLTRSGASLMPEGFEKQLSRTEHADLLAHLTDHGGFIPLDLQRVATATSARGMFNAPASTAERLVLADWGPQTVAGVPFYPIDPQEGRVRNVVLLYGPRGVAPPEMPRSVELKCGVAAKAIHMLGGVSGWGYPATPAGSVSMVVRLRYVDGAAEDHELKNGVHIADYLGDADVAGSTRAFDLGEQQLRYLAIEPRRDDVIEAIELIKGGDDSAPIVMAVTVESRR